MTANQVSRWWEQSAILNMFRQLSRINTYTQSVIRAKERQKEYSSCYSNAVKVDQSTIKKTNVVGELIGRCRGCGIGKFRCSFPAGLCKDDTTWHLFLQLSAYNSSTTKRRKDQLSQPLVSQICAKRAFSIDVLTKPSRHRIVRKPKCKLLFGAYERPNNLN